MKKLQLLAILIAGTILMVSCAKDEVTTPTDPNIKGIAVTENISSDQTWTTGSQYTLTGRIAVENGTTLTIEPGVIIYGQAGTGANATALIIAQGATILAQGTTDSPIIMTSIADKIVPGQIDSPNLSEDVDGLWGGLIVLGNAPIFVSGDNTTANIEGIPVDDVNGIYGGTDSEDNSGIITYLSVRHGGSNIGEGNEINGITFGGVGSGTTVSHIEVIANQDDGIEFFGGTVNVSNVLVMNNGDDAIDTDQGYSGTITNGLIINPGDKAFELDGGEGSDDAQTNVHTISNFSVKLDGAGGSIDVDDDTNVTLSGIYFYGMNDNTGTSYDMQDGKTGVVNTFINIEIIDTWDNNGTATATEAGVFLDEAKSSIVDAPINSGASVSSFSGWTFASSRSSF